MRATDRRNAARVAAQLDQDGQNQPFADHDLFDIDNVRVVLGK